jgi:hypothetical protein
METSAIKSPLKATQDQIPRGLFMFIAGKLQKRSDGGRPHFLAVQENEGRDPTDVMLEILELAWFKNKKPRKIARKFKTGYLTIWRIVRDLEPYKEQIVEYMNEFPRRGVFWNRTLDTSDYPTVQAYIKRAKQPPYVRRYKDRLRQAVKVWKAFGYKDPLKWCRDEVLAFLEPMTPAKASGFLDSIRVVAPQIASKTSIKYISTNYFRDRIRKRKKDIFKSEMKFVFEALRVRGMDYEETILKLHIQLGAREGADNNAGMTFLKWSFFRRRFTRVDIYESKSKGGMWCRDCPLDHLFSDLPDRLRRLWESRGKPIDERVILGGYTELRLMYVRVRKMLKEYYEGKIDPALLREFETIRPHDAGRIHCNLYWEAEVPIEVLAGQYLGQGEGIGLCGRIWLSTNTIQKYYLSLTQRSDRYKKIVMTVLEYAKDFDGGVNI